VTALGQKAERGLLVQDDEGSYSASPDLTALLPSPPDAPPPG
jgi:hypothetical protein